MTPAFVLAVALAAGAPPADPFDLLNQSFRTMYKETRTALLKQTDPVLLAFSSDHLVLLHHGERHEAPYIPRQVNALKTVAHMPLAIYATLLPHAGAPLPQTVRDALSHYGTQVRAIQPHISREFTAEQVPRQERVVAASLGLLGDAVAGTAITKARLDEYARAMRSLVYGNIHDAARLSLAALHQQVLQWRPLLDQDAWQRLRIVVVTSHMARTHEATVEYFLHLTHEHEEGNRVIVAEGLWQEDAAMDLLGVHVLDSVASKSFFGDSQRLHRDVMSDAAMDYLNTLDDID